MRSKTLLNEKIKSLFCFLTKNIKLFFLICAASFFKNGCIYEALFQEGRPTRIGSLNSIVHGQEYLVLLPLRGHHVNCHFLWADPRTSLPTIFRYFLYFPHSFQIISSVILYYNVIPIIFLSFRLNLPKKVD